MIEHDLTAMPVRNPCGPSPETQLLKPAGHPKCRQAAVTGLEPQHPYVLALSTRPDGGGVLEPLAAFTTNPAGAAIVNALGPIRQIVQEQVDAPRSYLVIAPGTPDQHGAAVQIQAR